MFTFNHALDDQQSVNNIVSDLFYYINNSNNKNPEILALSKTRDQQSRDSSFPQRVGLLTDHIPPLPSIETVIAPERPNFRTAKWSAYQVMNMLSNALIIPKHVQNVISTAEDKKNTIYTDPNTRKTFTRRFIINKETFTKFRLVCRKNGVSITHALSAIESILTASLIDGHFLGKVSVSKDESTTSQNQIKLRFLLSVSLRPFASPSYITSVLGDLSTTTEMIPSSSPLSSLSVSRDWASGAVACAAGALDYIISVPSSNLHQMIVTQDTTQKGKSDSAIETFWNLAKTCSDTTDRLINKEKFVPESVRLFGIGMNIPGLDILKAVEVEANSYTSLGRGFSCGVSNAGIGTFPSVRVPADVASDIESELSVEEVYFGTSHGRNGVLSLLSCLTVNEQLCGCLQFTAPLTTPQEADCLLEALIRLIDRLS